MNIVSGIRTRLPLNSVLKLVDFVSMNYFSGILVRRGIAVHYAPSTPLGYKPRTPISPPKTSNEVVYII